MCGMSKVKTSIGVAQARYTPSGEFFLGLVSACSPTGFWLVVPRAAFGLADRVLSGGLYRGEGLPYKTRH